MTINNIVYLQKYKGGRLYEYQISSVRLGYEYGEDHVLTNNWNPDEDYGNEYSNVYFNIDTPAYDGMNGGWEADERETIGKEIDRLFTSLGWKCNEPGFNGVCATYTKGKSHLYMHPQNYSGEVLKNEIKSVAEAIEKAETFSLRWVVYMKPFMI